MTLPSIDHEHALETYKSLIQISLAGFKLLALLNGGAAVALLAYLGNVAGKFSTIPDLSISMSWFLFGLVLCALAMSASYLTQLALHNRARGSVRGIVTSDFWLLVAFFFCLASLGAFSAGSMTAVDEFRNFRFDSARSAFIP